MGIHDGHRDRMRGKLLRYGEDTFEDHELLEMLLYSAVPRKDTNPLAHELIDHFGSLYAVLAAPAEELQKFPNIGRSAAALIKLVAPLYRRAAMSASENNQRLDTLKKIGDFFVTLFVAESHEIAYQLCMDANGRRLNLYKISKGDSASVVLNVRQIVENTILCQASIVALAHNHPSGLARPSQEDVIATRQIQDALETVGVYLADHVIVANGDYISLRHSGYIE